MNDNPAEAPELTDVGRVRFPTEQLQQHDSEIIINRESGLESRYEVHLGFLQIHHHYQIKFSVKDNLGEDLTADPLQNLHCKVTEVMPSEDGEGHDFTIDFKAHKEKLIQEELTLTDANDTSKTLLLILHARVLGKGKGTPSLKRGIHCTGIDIDEESEGSDWQGFD